MPGTKFYKLDKFVGLNESVDGPTEMKLGEASRCENWTVTDGFNLQTRPGIARLVGGQRTPSNVLAFWSGFAGDEEVLIAVDVMGGTDRIFTITHTEVKMQVGALGLTQEADSYVKVFAYAGNIFIMSAVNTVILNGWNWEPAQVHIPIVSISTAPSGGGEKLENINMLTNKRRIEFSADGEATAFVFPSEAQEVTALEIDNVSYPPADKGTWDKSKHTFTFKEIPIKGVSNIMFEYTADPALTAETKLRLAKMRLTETYNGATDTRLFMAGDGTEICFYSGVPESGDLSKLYFPAMNEIKVDNSASPITGLTRHYGKLLVYKPDGVFAITYQPVTLEGGETIAGFFMRSVSKGLGSSTMGQLQTVDNYPRSIANGSVYEWRMENQGYRDERNYVVVSDNVSKTLRQALGQNLQGEGYEKIVTCDDSDEGTYYVFLNDLQGTVLVNRYLLGRKPGVWTIYRSKLFTNVTASTMFAGTVCFTHNGDIFHLVRTAAADAPEDPAGETEGIKCRWESGFMGYDADQLRKYSSMIYVSLLPESYGELCITAETNRRSEYLTKCVSENQFSFRNLTFPLFTFNTMANPQIHRVRLKVKKFVYYKLVLTSDKKYSKVTVLGIDQQIRYSSLAK